MMRGVVFIGMAGAMLLPFFAPSAMAQMSSDEIYRRLELQSQNVSKLQHAGSVTRGMQLNYGSESSISTVTGDAYVPSATSAVSIDDGLQQPVNYGSVEQVYETTTLPASSADDPVGLFYPTEQTPAPQSVSLDTYTPVQEQARIDLRVYFEWNSASLKPEAIAQLAELCSAIHRVSPDRTFRVIGHTDKSGSDAYNLYLSQARAREVKRHLVEECAIPEGSLLAIGEGERQSDPGLPELAPDERRVEIQLIG